MRTTIRRNLGVVYFLDAPLSEIPGAHKPSYAKPLAVYERDSINRYQAVDTGYARGGYTIKEIGDDFGLHYFARHSSKLAGREGKMLGLARKS